MFLMIFGPNSVSLLLKDSSLINLRNKNLILTLK